jgi:hypothetical protein
VCQTKTYYMRCGSDKRGSVHSITSLGGMARLSKKPLSMEGMGGSMSGLSSRAEPTWLRAKMLNAAAAEEIAERAMICN